MASFESLSNVELRKKLLDLGYDLPVSINREFLLKKLLKFTEAGTGGGSSSRRKSTPVNSRPNTTAPTTTAPATNNNTSSTTKNNRLSLNETGLRQRQGSREPEVNISRGRKSTGSILGASSPASQQTSNRSSLSSTTTSSSSRSTHRQSSSLHQTVHSPTLNQVVEAQELGEEDDEEEEDEDGEEVEEDDMMDIDEGIDLLPNTRGITKTRVGPSLNFLNTNSPSSSSYLTRRPRDHRESWDREETISSDHGGDGSGDNSANSSSRFQSYLNYFKGDTRSDPLAKRGLSADSPPGSNVGGRGGNGGFFTPRSSPYSSNSGVRSSYGRYEENSSGEEDEEEEGEIRESKISMVLSKVNPVNWIRNNAAKFSWSSASNSNTGAVGGGEGSSQTESYNSYSRGYSTASPAAGGSGGVLKYPRYSTTVPSSNGHWGGNPYPPPTAGGLSNRIYSPATPPPVVVPPQVAAGRQAGFKAFFSRGERNGYGYSSVGGGGTTDWTSSSHLISKIILALFILTFTAFGGIYYYKASISLESGKGLTAARNIVVKSGSGTAGVPRPTTPLEKIKPISTSMVYPICGLEGVDPKACVPKNQIMNSRTLLTALKKELNERSKMKGCGGENEDILSLQGAKNALYRLTDLKKSEVDAAFVGMLLLVTENLNSGLKIESNGFSPDEDISSRDIQSLDNNIATITATGVSPKLLCVIWDGIYNLIGYSVFLSIMVGIGYLSWMGIRYYRGRKVREEQEVFGMIDKILELLYQHYEQSKNSDTASYLAVNHIRDELLSSRDRKKKEALWNQVVDHVSTNESRVRTEIQHISGEDFRVWRWLPSASPLVASKYSTPPSSPNMGRHSLPAQSQSPQSLSPANPSSLYPSLGGMNVDLDCSGGGNPLNMTNKWQGQAFEMFDGSPNALPIIPTPCLKIRQMFDAEKDSADSGQHRIERAILEKCPNSKILHIGIETGSQEGCVYVLCQSKDDSRAAYINLHGWWFDGHLLSVKFLREQRYFTRFPEAKFRTVPLTMSTLSSPIVQPLAGQQTFSNSMNIRSGSNNHNNNAAGPTGGPGTSAARPRYSSVY